MSARDRLVDALERAGCRPTSSGAARCPAHEDQAPSLSFRAADKVDGVVVKCHAGCTPAAIADALGLTVADLFDEPRHTAGPAGSTPRVVAEYVYTDEHGEVLFHSVRFEPKTFKVRRQDGRGGWVWRIGDTRRVLYRLPEVLAAVQAGEPVYVVEGEKDADRLAARGLTATCNVFGAGKWRPEYADSLTGAHVRIVADRDEPGYAHARQVAASLDGLAASLALLEPAAGKDVSDHLAAGLPLEQLRSLAADPTTDPTTAPEPVGDREAVAALYPPLDWHELWAQARAEPEWLCEPLIEAGRVVALFSPAKTGKSLLTLEIAAALAAGRPVLGNPAQQPLRVVYVDLENSPDDLRERLEHLGYGPHDLAELRYLSFPSLPALDSMAGGAALLAVAQHHDARLVVLDTVSRVIGGEEDSADTFRALYRHAIMPLKAEGRAVLRLDHSGKNLDKGQRGSSGKADDVDAVWSLARRNDTTFDLRRTHSRTNHGADHLAVVRRTSPLRHEVSRTSQPSQAEDLARQLDVLGVPATAGRDTCRKALKDSEIKASNDLLEAAIKVRKAGADLPGAGRADDDDLDDQPPTLRPARTPARSARGQVAGRSGSQRAGTSDDLPAAPPLQGRGRQSAAPAPVSRNPRPTAPLVDCICRFDLADDDHFDYCRHAPQAAS